MKNRMHNRYTKWYKYYRVYAPDRVVMECLFEEDAKNFVTMVYKDSGHILSIEEVLKP